MAEMEMAEVEMAEVEMAEAEMGEVEMAEVQMAEVEMAEMEAAEVETAEVEMAGAAVHSQPWSKVTADRDREQGEEAQQAPVHASNTGVCVHQTHSHMAQHESHARTSSSSRASSASLPPPRHAGRRPVAWSSSARLARKPLSKASRKQENHAVR